MERFYFDVVLEASEICNLKEDREYLWGVVSRGGHVIYTGRRNTGKTSIVKSILIPQYRREYPKALVVFADFMGVQSLRDIVARLKQGYSRALSEKQDPADIIKNLGRQLKNLHPKITIDALSGEPTFGLSLEEESLDENALSEVWTQFGVHHKKSRVLIVIDEFQDIADVPGAEALLRDSMQNLPANLPIVLLGSKKHLLGQIFGVPNAPLANWGHMREISEIRAEEYQRYIQKKLNTTKVTIDLELTRTLIEKMQGIPESINIVCDRLQRTVKKNRSISLQDIHASIEGVLAERSSLYEERLSFFSEKEQTFLSTLAKHQPVKQPTSREFLSMIRMSPGGSRPLTMRLERQAIIYKTESGYVIGDPLLSWYLIKYR